METVWQLQEAKSKLSTLVTKAVEEGPQIITRRGVETVVVISYQDYQRLQRPRRKLSELFRNSPLGELDLTRDPSLLEPGPEL